MNKTSQLIVTASLLITALAAVSWTASDLAAQQPDQPSTPEVLSTKKSPASSPGVPVSQEKTPIQFEADLEEIMAIRKKLGGGVAEQLKGLNLQLDPNKAESTIDQQAPAFRELLRQQRNSFDALAKDLVDAANSNPKADSPNTGSERMEIPPGHKVVSFKLPPEDAVPSILRPGDFVDVISKSDTIAKSIKVFLVDGHRVGLLMSDQASDVLDAARKQGQLRLVLRSEPDQDPMVRTTSILESPGPRQRVRASPAQTPHVPGFGPVHAPPFYPTPAGVVQRGSNQVLGSRTRKAARLVEEAAAELEESGQYELADQLRQNAQKIWESAR